MRPSDFLRRLLLAFSVVGIAAGATFLSDGMCGGGGGGGGRYMAAPVLAAR